jgi:hypothetical protein
VQALAAGIGRPSRNVDDVTLIVSGGAGGVGAAFPFPQLPTAIINDEKASPTDPSFDLVRMIPSLRAVPFTVCTRRARDVTPLPGRPRHASVRRRIDTARDLR